VPGRFEYYGFFDSYDLENSECDEEAGDIGDTPLSDGEDHVPEVLPRNYAQHTIRTITWHFSTVE
jgi:hypothetical protein